MSSIGEQLTAVSVPALNDTSSFASDGSHSRPASGLPGDSQMGTTGGSLGVPLNPRVSRSMQHLTTPLSGISPNISGNTTPQSLRIGTQPHSHGGGVSTDSIMALGSMLAAADPSSDPAGYFASLAAKTEMAEGDAARIAIASIEAISKLQYALRGLYDRSGRTTEQLDLGTKAITLKLEKLLLDISLASQALETLFDDLDNSRSDLLARLATPAVIDQVASGRHTAKLILPSQLGDQSTNRYTASPTSGRPYSLLVQLHGADGAQSGSSVDMMSFLKNAPNGGTAASSPTGGPAPLPAQSKMFAKLPKEVQDANLPKPELMRLMAVYELLDTEADYCRDLSTIISFHKVQMRESRMVPEQEINHIFSNVEQLLAANQNLLNKLQARRDQNAIIQEIGDVIADAAESLKVYTIYASNYPSAMKLVYQLAARPENKDTLQKWMSSPEGRGLSLESFLIKPVQRICKYPLLIRELERHTEKAGNTADQANLRNAAEKIEAVVMLVNEATRHAEERQRVLNLEASIESPVPLGFADKKHIKDGPLQRLSNGKVKDRFVLLFTDVLLICKLQKTPNKYELEGGYSLAELMMRNDSRDSLRAKNTILQFNVITSEDREQLTLVASSEEERQRWAECFHFAFKDITEEHRSAVKNTINASLTKQQSQTDVGGTFGRGTLKMRGKTGTVRQTTLSVSSAMMRKQVAARKSLMESWMVAGSGNAHSLHEPEIVEISGAIYKRAFAATGHIYYFCIQTRQTIGKLPENYTIVDSAGPPSAHENENQDMLADNQRQSMEVEDEDNVLLDLVDGFPDWRRVDRGDGMPYFFNINTQETRWESPGSPTAAEGSQAESIPADV
ncbi:hypothetical protein BC831DRAFT_456795 [Entophlyctis helioformis]|nr:hypothetical protein BC831DRAFT_456795 [Entophlyctis helioformis]